MVRNLLLASVVLGGGALLLRHAAAEGVVRAPAPQVDTVAAGPDSETAILSGGCFWGMQDVFQHVRGVTAAVSGYTGGDAATAHYDEVSSGTTGHAESVRISFDPKVVSYGTILRIFVSVAADPTELNYQGPDEGSQYRSEIWVEGPEQRRIAEAYLAQLAAAHVYHGPIVTRVDAAKPFYPAEAYHQNYATLHPDSAYIAIYDAPKVTALATLFPRYYRAQPALVQVAAR